MDTKYLAALDAGTSGIRCLIIDIGGKILSASRREYRLRSKSEIAPLGKEFDPEELWQMTCESISSAVIKAKIDPQEIAAVCPTSQREGTVFLNQGGQELYMGPNIDLRAVVEGLNLDSRFADNIHQITGHLPSLLFVPARLKWFQNNQPELFSHIATVLSISDWLIFRLCGEKVGEICSAIEMGLGDVRYRRYSSELCDMLDLPADIFPRTTSPGQMIGEVIFQAADVTGIPRGTPVVQSAPDSHCGLIGLGLKENLQAGIISGWSTPVQMITGQPIFDADRRIWTGCHAFPDKWILESNSGESGNALNWIKEMLFSYPSENPVQDKTYNLMDQLALSASVGADGVTAFTGPEAMDMRNLKLRLGGLLFPVPFSAAGVSKAQLARAVLENIAFAVKINCHQVEKIANSKIIEIRFGGGLARSKCLKYILPAILDKPISFADVTETSGLGAAILAAVGSGIYTDLEEAMSAMASPLELITPDRLLAAEYAECYQSWLSLSCQLNELGERIN